MNSASYQDFALSVLPAASAADSFPKPDLFAVRLPGSRPAYHVTVFPAHVYGKTYAAKTLCGIRIFRTAQAVTGSVIASDLKTEPCPRCAQFVLRSRPSDFPVAFGRKDGAAS